MTVLHVQQGGSSGEMYVHLHGTRAEADDCRKECERNGYRCSADVPTRVKLTPGVIELLDAVADGVVSLV